MPPQLLTVTVTLDDRLQPLALVTVTVYVVLVVGETVMAAVVAPLLHRYVPPPLAVKVVVVPLHTLVLPEIDAVGNGFTVTVVAADVAPQPLAFLTVAL